MGCSMKLWDRYIIISCSKSEDDQADLICINWIGLDWGIQHFLLPVIDSSPAIKHDTQFPPPESHDIMDLFSCYYLGI